MFDFPMRFAKKSLIFLRSILGTIRTEWHVWPAIELAPCKCKRSQIKTVRGSILMAKLEKSDIKKENLSVVQERLHEGVSQDQLDECLCEACRIGAFDKVRALVGEGANVNCQPIRGELYYSPLHLVVDAGGERSRFTFGHLCVLFYLITRGANIRAKAGKHGIFGTPLKSAIWDHRYYLLPLLLIFYLISFINPWTWKTRPVSACPECGRGLKERPSERRVAAQVDATRFMARNVMVTEEYCPKCGHITNRDVYRDARRGQEELEMMARR